MVTVKNSIIILAGLLVGWMSATFSVSTVSQNANPQLAVSAWPSNGFARSRLINDWLVNAVLENGEQMSVQIDQDIYNQAQRAFRDEPLAYQATRIAALNAETQNDIPQARELMRDVIKITKRDLMSHMWLIQDYSNLSDIEKMLDHYDLVLRTSSQATAAVMPRLAAAMANDVMVGPMKRLLLPEPDWAVFFWPELPRTPPSLINAAVLRSELANEGVGNPAKNDVDLLKSLVADRNYDEAFSLYTSLSSANSRQGNRRKQPLQMQPDMQYDTALPPFDWETISTGEYGAGINPNGKSITISALPDSYGTVAQKLIKLDSSSYEISMKIIGQAPEKGRLTAGISCAQSDKNNYASAILIDKRSVKQKLTIPSSECKYFWFKLDIENSGNSSVVEYGITSISLTKIG